MGAESETNLPTEEELRALPRWARVAFAARCARRVQPLIQQLWKAAPAKHVKAIELAITLAEQSASMAASGDAAACAAASTAANAAADAAPTTCSSAQPASCAAGGAVRAAGSLNNAHLAKYAADAADAAGSLSGSKPLISEAIQRDFQTLLQLAKDARWNDATPVSPSVFGPMWPDGPPAGWPAENEQVPDALIVGGKDLRVVLKILVDGKVPPEEIAGELFKLYKALNEYHLARGGSGLTIDQFRYLIGASVGAEV